MTCGDQQTVLCESGQEIRERICALFERIERERMADIPLLNEALSVAAFGFDHPADLSETPAAAITCASLQTYRVGVLLTPWFMNLLLLPLQPEALDDLEAGEKVSHILPAGRFEFVVGQEGALGLYLSCSLFSPVFQFEDQDTACLTAQAVLEEVLTSPEGEPEINQDEENMQAIWRGELPAPEEAPEVAELGEDSSPAIVQTSREAKTPQALSRRDLLRGMRPSASQVGREERSESGGES